MKPFSFTNRKMTIKTYIFYSFLVHAIMLFYLLTLPIYRGSINLKSFEGYFVYLRSEEVENAGKPPLVQRKARDEKAVSEKEVVAEETAKRLEPEKAVSESESGLKMEETVDKKVTEVVEVKEPSEPEKALKEETPAVKVKETEVAKKEEHKAEVETKEVTMKATPLAEKSEEVVKPKAEIKPEMVIDAEVAHSVPIEAAKEKEMVLKEEVTASEGISLKVKETPSPAKETMHVEKAEKAVVSEIESGLKMKEVAEEKVARAVEVKEPLKLSSDGKALKEEAPAAVKEKEKKLAKAEVHKVKPVMRGAKKKALATSKDKTSRGVSKLKKSEGASPQLKEANIEKGTLSPVLPEAASDNKLALSEEGLKEETVHIEDEGGSVAEILTSEKNRMPSQEDYFLKQDEEKKQAMAGIKTEAKEETRVEEKRPPSGIPLSDVLLSRDITIEVFLRKSLPKATEITNISFEESADIVKIRIKGNGLMTSDAFSLDNNRIVIDIPDVMMNAPLPPVVVSPLKGIRSGKHGDKIRLVLDLKEMMNFHVSSFGDSVVVALQRLGKEPPLSPEAQKPEAAERKPEMSSVLLQLFKKAHPMVNRKDDSEKQKKVGVLEEKEETHVAGILGVKRVFLAKAEKGSYIFVIMNKDEKAYEADVVFRLFEGKEGERIKEFKTVGLPPDAVIQFKFILPEALFWDDEYYFTGAIESSNTLTKFSEKTGLIWKEEKDY